MRRANSSPRLFAVLVPVALTAVTLLASRANAQAFNIEFDSASTGTASVPQSTFGAAAGQTGSWMRINTGYLTNRVLTTTTGEVSAVTLTVGVQGNNGGILGYDTSNTGDYANLLNDGIEAWTDACMSYPSGLFLSVRGLSNGQYDVYVYAARPDGSLPMNTYVDVSGSSVQGRITGYPPTNSLVESLNYTVHHTTVTNGGLFIGVQDADYDTYLAGFQIVPVQIGDCSVTQQPVDRNVLKDQTATFSAAFTGDVRTYQWMRNGVDLVNARGISGVTTPTLTIAEARPSDNAVYSLRYTCGGFIRTTSSATLTVTVPPPADFNHSGVISVQDIFDFLAAYFAGV
jgi:hypothetical protein